MKNGHLTQARDLLDRARAQYLEALTRVGRKLRSAVNQDPKTADEAYAIVDASVVSPSDAASAFVKLDALEQPEGPPTTVDLFAGENVVGPITVVESNAVKDVFEKKVMPVLRGTRQSAK